MNNKILRVFFLGMSLSMVYIVAVTSMASDMFNLSPIVLNEPWFKTTLIDFYFNIAIISAWMIYKEAHLLKMFCQHKNDVLTRSEALAKIWGEDNYFTARSMDVFVTKLRKYLRKDANLQIMNIHGNGFRLIEKDKVDL